MDNTDNSSVVDTTPTTDTTPVPAITDTTPVPPITDTTPTTDTTPVPIAPPALIHSLEYTNITTEIGNLLSSNKQAFISIFNNEAGTDYALDNLGNPVNNLQITSISVTDSYTDPNTNEIINANIKLLFNTNGEFINIDDDDVFWYVITSADFPTRRFGLSY